MNPQLHSGQLSENRGGGYRFLHGIAAYSSGVVSNPGFEIVYVTLQRPAPVAEGLGRVAEFLAKEGRPKAALCSISLRSPRPYSFQGFADFNSGYAAILNSWDLMLNGINPVARTNVAPVVDPPKEPVLYGFAFTRSCPTNRDPTFVVAGAGELPEGVLTRDGIVSLGDVSEVGLKAKARFVMDLIENRLHGLGVDWPSVSCVNVYTACSLTPIVPEIVLSNIGAAAMHGVRWYYSRPPIEEIEYEMDVRGTRTEIRWG
ncbi:MAG: hypothetical protein WD468_03675 [Pirellulales bacterium]